MVTQVTPIIATTANDNVDADKQIPASSAGDVPNYNVKGATIAGDDADHEPIIRWERAAPPKFRRLVANNSNSKSRMTTEEIEERRATTRFVYLENMSSGTE